MKKLFAFMLCAIAFCACSNDDEEPVIEETTTYNQVVVEEKVEAPKVKPKAKKKVEE